LTLWPGSEEAHRSAHHAQWPTLEPHGPARHRWPRAGWRSAEVRNFCVV